MSSSLVSLELHQRDTFFNSFENTIDSGCFRFASSGGMEISRYVPRCCLALLRGKSRVVKQLLNPVRHVNAITTRSGKTLEGPSNPLVPTPVVSIPQSNPRTKPVVETVNGKSAKTINLENTAHVPPPEEEESIFMEIPKPKAKKTVNVEIQDLNSPRPNSYQSKLPYPERMKVRENDKPSAQHSRFLKMFKQLRLEIGLKDALVKMPKFNKWLSSSKEQRETRGDRHVRKLDRTSALADSGASINLLPHSIYKQLGLELDFLLNGHTSLPLVQYTCSSFSSSSPMKTSDSTFEEFINEFIFFKLIAPNDKDVEIKSSSSFTLTSPEESEFEALLKWIEPTILKPLVVRCVRPFHSSFYPLLKISLGRSYPFILIRLGKSRRHEEKHKRKEYFALDALSKHAQSVNHTDAMAGNPCEFTVIKGHNQILLSMKRMFTDTDLEVLLRS
ncbi:hypothetical protein Tco_0717116 [Tanacetum coccineum]